VSSVEPVSVADLIFQLRGDLYRAAWQGEGKDPKFMVGPVELELTVVVDSSRGGGAKAALWVVDVSAEGKRSVQSTHRIKLTLQPVGPDGQPSKIAGPLGRPSRADRPHHHQPGLPSEDVHNNRSGSILAREDIRACGRGHQTRRIMELRNQGATCRCAESGLRRCAPHRQRLGLNIRFCRIQRAFGRVACRGRHASRHSS
jgi:hypothetical protein